MAQQPKPPKPPKPASIKVEDVYDLVGVVYDLLTVVENNIQDLQASQLLILNALAIDVETISTKVPNVTVTIESDSPPPSFSKFTKRST